MVEPAAERSDGASTRTTPGWHVASSAAVVTVANTLALVLSVLGLLVLTRRQGLGPGLDGFWISMTTATIVGQVPSAVSWAVLIPATADLVQARRRAEAWSIHLTFLTGLVSILVALVSALWVAAPLVLRLTGPGLPSSEMSDGAVILRLLLVYAACTALASLFAAVLNSEGSFLLPAVCGGLSGAAGLVALVPDLIRPATHAYCVGLVAGAALGATIQAVVLVRRWPSGPVRFCWGELRRRGIVGRSAGIAAVRVADYLPSILLRGVASLVGVGSASAVGLASNLMQPPTLLASAVATVLFPSWAADRQHNNLLHLPPSLDSVSRMVLWLLALFSVAAAALSPVVSSLLADPTGGSGTPSASVLSLSFAAVIVGWPWIGVNFLVGSAFWASGLVRGRIVLEAAYIVLVGVLLVVFFWSGAPGLLLGQSLAFLALLLAGWRVLSGSGDSLRAVSLYLVRVSLLAAAIGGGALWACLWAIDQTLTPVSAWGVALVVAAVGMGAFLLGSEVLGVNTSRAILATWRGRQR